MTLTTTKIQDIYTNRPFRTRNADEFELQSILDLFVDPTNGLIGPFEYDNEIIKGKMGSGKTMYLRANYAYYLYTLVPSIMANADIILPIYIKLSDFQNMKDSESVYSSIIVNIVKEMVESCRFLQSSENLSKLHNGFLTFDYGMSSRDSDIDKVIANLRLLTAEEYIEKVNKEISTSGSVGNSIFGIAATHSKGDCTEIRQKKKPQLDDVVSAYNTLLAPFGGKLLILFDEVGSIHRTFFKEDSENSIFEVLLNQLRTLSFVRTKIAIYPQSFADILTETRYGNVVQLESNVVEESGYEVFLNSALMLIRRYICNIVENTRVEDLFDVDNAELYSIEQIINASDGNMRRFVHLVDLSMNTAFKRNNGNDKVTVEDVFMTLREHAQQMESLFPPSEREFLGNLVKVCKKRAAYQFSFPNKALSLQKYISKSQEFNILNLIEVGAGRKSSIFSFDYAYCVLYDIPTHYTKGTERLDKSRSRASGERIGKVTKITDSLIEQASIIGKIEGEITFLNESSTIGFVSTEEGHDCLIIFVMPTTATRESVERLS